MYHIDSYTEKQLCNRGDSINYSLTKGTEVFFKCAFLLLMLC